MSILDRYTDEALVGKSPQTVHTYCAQLLKFDEWLRGSGTSLVEGLSRVDVQQYVTWLTSRGQKASSVNLAYNSIRSFAKWSGQNSAVTNIRVVRTTPVLQRTPKSLDRNERNRLLRLVEQRRNKRDIAIVTLLLHCGLRVGELVALNIKDLELQRGGLVYINHGKGDKERVVPATAEVRNRITEYLKERPGAQNDDSLFLSNRCRRISARSVERLLQQLGDWHPHQLRHTFVRGLLDSGVDLVTAAKLAGHSDLNVTRSYATPSIEQMQTAIERLYVDD